MDYSKLNKIIPKKRSGGGSGAHGGLHSQKHLNSLRRHAVPPGKVLNPYGSLGNTFRSRYRLGDRDHLAWRPKAMKRKRLVLKEKKKMALEMHELQQLARESASDAMRTLIQIANNKRAPEPSRIAAASVILDRGYGKSTHIAVSASLNNGKAKDIPSDDLDKRIANTLKRVEEFTRRTPKEGKSEKRPADLRKYH